MASSTTVQAELLPNEEDLPKMEAADQPVAVGILIHDPMNWRLIETATTQLELRAVKLHADELDYAELAAFEMIIAEEPYARQIQGMLGERERQVEGINPAIIAVYLGERPIGPAGYQVDGVLTLPVEPAPLVAQLSLMLYAHRAFARKYHSALEELHLNRRIFRSVTSGISVANASEPDLPLVYVNPAFEVMTGYHLEEVLGKNCRFLQRQDTAQPGLDVIREAIRDGREAVVVLKNYRKDGTFFWNELSLSPIRNRHGVVTHLVGIQTDVTARMEFEAALRESEKLAAVGRLASSIAHEINNPLESVMNLLYLAQQTDDPVEVRRYLQAADGELKRVSLITAQSLRFYKQSTRPMAIYPAELMDSVSSMYAGLMENSHVSLQRRYRGERMIVCLESEIRQVLNNLVRNAIDAMRMRGGTLVLRSREAMDWRSGARGVAIMVADTGSGMSAETIKSIYTAFFTTKGIGGTGLGLWISSEIVARHKGRLLVRSSQREGKRGTVFLLWLPFESGVVRGGHG
ncbi:two-component system sensor histidine kinase NtrB [Granulicella aggregans]|jgi:PAS domain S-box-containing protein|uniref:two-component system sensor histidine kinase NtrB n=1 Tax=Granulicella aggregans TaxID=474949 RepID=UPI0021E0EB14|nr:PAS domain-containing protein [Granulicella aggregans]